METVLITGASRGIGLELTRQFLHLGYRVIATYRGEPSDGLSGLATTEALSLAELEVTESASIEKLANKLAGIKIDILINNAGVIGPDEQTFETLDADVWTKVFAVNTIAPMMVSRALIDCLKQSANAKIITVSSQMGSLNRNNQDMIAYRSSKAALNKVMQVMALELKDQGVTVCPVHPGWVRTDMGGSNADISVVESASGIINLVRGLTLEQSGKFFTWQGQEHAW